MNTTGSGGRISLDMADSGGRQRWPEQAAGFNLFSFPWLRRFLRWRYARLVFQLPLLILVVIMVIDGLSGRQLAPRNVATTASWLHYRGLVVIALAVFGNAFCAACPLLLTRGPSRFLRRLLPASLQLRWPRALRGKYVVLGLLLVFFFAYEYFDLWASPWLTAWVIIGYFIAALSVDVLFPAGTFCRYVCPLGNFNFVLSHTSPTQIVAVDRSICDTCEHKPCLHGRETFETRAEARGEAAFIPLTEITNANGTGFFPGCETGLFAPAMTSSMDCTNCYNCVRACPYDNVGLRFRSPVSEATSGSWARRGRLSVMVLGTALASLGLLNAAAMVAPFFSFVDSMAAALGTRSEAVLFTILFSVTTVLGPGLTTITGMLADRAGGRRSTPREALMRWGYVTVVLGIGFWVAHYVFHFLTGALQIVPVLQNFAVLRGLNVTPDWGLSQLVPSRYLFAVVASLTSLWSLLAAYVSMRIAIRDFGRRGVLAMWPVLIFVLLFSALAVWLLGQPMEMRGTLLQPLAQ